MVRDAMRLRFSELSTAPPVQFIEPVSSGAVYDHGFGVGDPGAVVDPYRDSGTSEGADPAAKPARGCAIGDQPDLDAALLCPDQCLDGARILCEAVGVDKDLCLSPVDSID